MVITATSSTEAKLILQQRPELDIIILDWLLDEENAIEAQELLNYMRKKTFAPIIIYTDKGKEPPSLYLRENKLDRMSIVFNKSEVKGENLFKEIGSWLLQKPELRIFLRWSRQVEHTLNETLWDIYNLDVNGIKSIIRLLQTQDDLSQLSQEEEIVNFFSRILSRKLGNQESLLKLIKQDIQALPKLEEGPKPIEKKEEEKTTEEKQQLGFDEMRTFHSFERYKLANSKLLWTGSILRNKAGKYFVVVTPACDFSHKNKIENILLLKAEPVENYVRSRQLSKGATESCLNHRTACVHFLPYAAELKDGLICRFDNIFNIEEKQLRKNIDNAKLTCLMVIDSPFIENLIQRMNAYLMRVGTRDIDNAEILNLLNNCNAKPKTD